MFKKIFLCLLMTTLAIGLCKTVLADVPQNGQTNEVPKGSPPGYKKVQQHKPSNDSQETNHSQYSRQPMNGGGL